MSIPAARIKQIRAIYAKLRKQHPTKNYSRSPKHWSAPGRGILAAHAASRKVAARKISDWRSGKKVPSNLNYLYPHLRGRISDASTASIPISYYDPIELASPTVRNLIRKDIRSGQMIWEYHKRKGARRSHVKLKKILRGEAE